MIDRLDDLIKKCQEVEGVELVETPPATRPDILEGKQLIVMAAEAADIIQVVDVSSPEDYATSYQVVETKGSMYSQYSVLKVPIEKRADIMILFSKRNEAQCETARKTKKDIDDYNRFQAIRHGFIPYDA